jgi:hypothetical protein
MKTMRLLAVVILAASLGGTDSTAQDKQEEIDPQSRFEPRSKPGEGQKLLEKFVGDWVVVKTFHPRTGKPVEQKGACKQEMIHGGRFLQSSFAFGDGDAKTTGLGLIGFEANSGTFTSAWTDSRATRMSFRKSKEKFDGKQVILHGVSLGEAKQDRAPRTVTKLSEAGNKIVHRQYNRSGDEKERLIMELVMTRKATR